MSSLQRSRYEYIKEYKLFRNSHWRPRKTKVLIINERERDVRSNALSLWGGGKSGGERSSAQKPDILSSNYRFHCFPCGNNWKLYQHHHFWQNHRQCNTNKHLQNRISNKDYFEGKSQNTCAPISRCWSRTQGPPDASLCSNPAGRKVVYQWYRIPKNVQWQTDLVSQYATNWSSVLSGSVVKRKLYKQNYESDSFVSRLIGVGEIGG